jgi:hypothetical protein
VRPRSDDACRRAQPKNGEDSEETQDTRFNQGSLGLRPRLRRQVGAGRLEEKNDPRVQALLGVKILPIWSAS